MIMTIHDDDDDDDDDDSGEDSIFWPGLLLRGHGLSLRGNLGSHGGSRGWGADQVHWAFKLQQVRDPQLKMAIVVAMMTMMMTGKETVADKRNTMSILCPEDSQTSTSQNIFSDVLAIAVDLHLHENICICRRQVEEILLNAKKYKPAVLQVSLYSKS